MGGFIPTCYALTFVEIAKLESYMHDISPNLIRAYREAKFVVESNQPITLLVAQCNRDLSTLLRNHKESTAAFITAFNPYSKVQTDQENLQAQNELLKDIKELGLEAIHGYGQDVAEKWPREESLLIIGITESQAENLADKYSQNAFIWIGSTDAFPALRLRRPIALPTNNELLEWVKNLPSKLKLKAKELSPIEQAWIMSTSDREQQHWLDTGSWDLNHPWPLAKPDGSAMGIGTELDRMFKLIAAGQSQIARC
jgi:hypothetical protein